MTPSPWLKGPFTRPSNRAMGSPFDAPTSRPLPLAQQIATIFASGAPGLWVEADNAISTPWYQDSVGSTPFTAVGQTIGRAIDKSGRGNHLLQATAPARPLLSARVNLLTKTEDFGGGGAWNPYLVSVAPNTVQAPNGTLTADTLTGSNPDGGLISASTGAGAYSYSVYAKAGSTSTLLMNFALGGNGCSCAFNLASGTASAVARQGTGGTVSGGTSSIEDVGGGWYRCKVSGVVSTAPNNLIFASSTSSVHLWGAQLETDSVTRYQRVNTTDYDTAGFPLYDKFDGIDDGLSTAPFAAGTLTSDMDCFIAIRRDSAAQSMLAYPAAGGASYLGAMDATAGAASNGAGTPTFWVNGVAVPGGTATTRTQLAAAIPVGSWAVVEIRNADMSAWTALGFCGYTSFPLNAGVAAKLFCPAQSDAMRTTIRQYLAKKAGITL